MMTENEIKLWDALMELRCAVRTAMLDRLMLPLREGCVKAERVLNEFERNGELARFAGKEGAR